MNGDEHAVGAFLLTLFTELLLVGLSIVDLSVLDILFSSTIAIIGGLTPDILEPATWPGHRGFFHYVFGPGSLLPAALFFNSGNPISLGFSSICFGYFTHFLLDIFG